LDLFTSYRIKLFCYFSWCYNIS